MSEVRFRSQEDPMPEGRAAKRSYPTSEVRGSGGEYQTATAQERPRRATPHLRSGVAVRGVTSRPRSGAAARRRYPTHQARGQGQRVGGPTPHPRSRGCEGTGRPRGAIPR